MNKAIELVNLDHEFNGEASLYHLYPPLESYGEHYEFVIVSAVMSPLETYIFPASGPDCEKPTSFMDLRGSQKNVFSHYTVLEDLGYAVEKLDDK